MYFCAGRDGRGSVFVAIETRAWCSLGILLTVLVRLMQFVLLLSSGILAIDQISAYAAGFISRIASQAEPNPQGTDSYTSYN